MTDINIIIGFSFAIALSIFNTYIAFKSYSSTKYYYLLAQLLQLLWAILLPITNIIIINPDINHITGIIGTVSLSLSMLLNQFYFDDVTARYIERITLTLGVFAFGGLLGFILSEDGIQILGNGVITLSSPVLILFLVQSALLIFRFNKHIQNQNSLSDHYGIKITYSGYVERFGIYILAVLFLVSIIINFILSLDILFSVSFIIPLGYLVISLALYNDPLSSAIVGQKISAVALLSSGETKFLHILDSSGKSIAQTEDFSMFLNEMSLLMVEIAKSETIVRSLSTKDVLIMFEPCGDNILIFIMQYRGPLLRKLIRKMAKQIYTKKITTQEAFSKLVEESILGIEL